MTLNDCRILLLALLKVMKPHTNVCARTIYLQKEILNWKCHQQSICTYIYMSICQILNMGHRKRYSQQNRFTLWLLAHFTLFCNFAHTKTTIKSKYIAYVCDIRYIYVHTYIHTYTYNPG